MFKKPLISFVAMAALASALLGPEAEAATGRTPGFGSVTDTGQSSYQVPLYTPPGTNGVAPSLSLNYSQGAGNGYFGVGWTLSGLSGISRCASTWAQDSVVRNPRNDMQDRFCLDGQKMRLVSGTYGVAGSTYSTELEAFSRITAYGSAGNGPSYFTVETKDGLVYEYGATEDSRIQSVGQTTARFWAVSRVRDRSNISNGNAIKFNYTEDSVNGSFRISTIQYTENATKGVAPPYTVSFYYDDIPAGEIDNEYGMGSQINRVYRASRVDVTHADATLIRRYKLTYEAALSATSKSRLANIQECAGTDSNCFPATAFNYQNGVTGFDAEVSTGAPAASAPAYPIPMDVNGDGRDDLVYSTTATSGTGTWQVMFANSAGTYAPPVNTGITNYGFACGKAIDYNADGLEDLLLPYSGGTWWVALGNATGLSSPTNTNAPASGACSDNAVMDVNGDGLDDLVWADLKGWVGGDVIKYRLRVWGGAFTAASYDLSTPLLLNEKMTSGVFAPPGRHNMQRVPDFNGDGRGDLTYLKTTRIETEPSQYIYLYNVIAVTPGSGEFGASMVGSTYPQFMDINGDGLSDLIYTGGAPQWQYRLSTGTGFSAEYYSTSNVGQTGMFSVVDWDGDGREDILTVNTTNNKFYVWRSNGLQLTTGVDTGMSAANVDNVAVSDINGDGLADISYRKSGVLTSRTHTGPIPDLLLSATDGFGVNHTFSYVALPNYGYYTKGSGAAYPTQDIVPRIQVVSQLQTSDGAGSTYTLNSQYYHTARINLQGRGFLGFYYRSWWDSRDNTSHQRTFLQNFPYTGRLVTSRRATSDGYAIVEDEIAYQSYDYLPAPDQGRVFVYPRTVVHRDRDPALSGPNRGALLRTVSTTNSYDQNTGGLYDQVVTTTEPAWGANSARPGVVYTEHFYAPSLFYYGDSNCVGRPDTIHMRRSHTGYGGEEKLTITSLLWDGPHCRVERVIENYGSTELEVKSDFWYDDFGNPLRLDVTGVGSPVRRTDFVYSNATYPTGQFPLSVTNAEGQTTSAKWKYNLGVPEETYDVNNLKTTYQYDAFARRIRTDFPDSTYSTSTIHDCVYSPCGSLGKTYVMEELRAVVGNAKLAGSHNVFDAFDRPMKAYPSTLGSAADTTAVRTHEYDSFGRVKRSLVPKMSAAADTYWINYSYDLIGRVSQTSRQVDEINTAMQTTTFAWDGLTNTITDPQSKTVVRTLDAMGRIGRSADHNGYYQFFDYDAFGNLVRVQDPSNTLQSMTYFGAGVRQTLTDMDMGTWTYDTNAFGEVTHIQTPKSAANGWGWTQIIGYNKLGQMISRDDRAGTTPNVSSFNFGTTAGTRGKLVSIVGADGYQEQFTYDSTNNPGLNLSRKRIVADGVNYDYDYEYDSGARLWKLTYPISTNSCRFKVQYGYQESVLTSVTNISNTTNCGSDQQVFWQGNEGDAFGNYTKETFGNTVATRRAYDKVTGWIKSIQAGAGSSTSVQNFAYTWDKVGNLKSRQDVNQSLTESFFYDSVYRLHYSQLNGVTNLDMGYDLMGNIASKKEGDSTWSYTYHPTKKHQMASASDGSTSWAFGYDANGNMTSGREAVTWSSYNMPLTIENSSTSRDSAFSYTPTRAYWKQVAEYSTGTDGTSTTRYIGGLLERVTNGSNTEFRHQIVVGNVRIVVMRANNAVNNTYYFDTDHLGSTTNQTTTGIGTPVNASYSAFGARRGSNWQGSATNPFLASRRGFTDHTMLDNLELVHMNGRVYDQVIGRFLSADPYVTDPLNTQSYNRYSYVFNNPLSYTDPSGFDPDTVPGWSPSFPTTPGPWWGPRRVYPPSPNAPHRGLPCSPNCVSPAAKVPQTAIVDCSAGGLMPCFGGFGGGGAPGMSFNEDGSDGRDGAQQFLDWICSVGISWCVPQEGATERFRKKVDRKISEIKRRKHTIPTGVYASNKIGTPTGTTVITTGERVEHITNIVTLVAPAKLLPSRPGLSKFPRVGAATKTDKYHDFPDVVDNLADDGVRFKIPTRGPGGQVVRESELYQAEGSLNGVDGVFEWIIDQAEMTHRRFIPDGTITGYPNQVPGG